MVSGVSGVTDLHSLGPTPEPQGLHQLSFTLTRPGSGPHILHISGYHCWRSKGLLELKLGIYEFYLSLGIKVTTHLSCCKFGVLHVCLGWLLSSFNGTNSKIFYFSNLVPITIQTFLILKTIAHWRFVLKMYHDFSVYKRQHFPRIF